MKKILLCIMALSCFERTIAGEPVPRQSREEELRQLNESNRRIREWLSNLKANHGESVKWSDPPLSPQEEKDRDLVHRHACYAARLWALNEASRAATSGTWDGKPLPPEVKWSEQDAAHYVVLLNRKIEEAYLMWREVEGPRKAALNAAPTLHLREQLYKKYPEAAPALKQGGKMNLGGNAQQPDNKPSGRSKPAVNSPAPTAPPPAPSAESKARTNLNMAKQYIRVENFEKAAEYANRILTEAPNSPEAEEAKTVLQFVQSKKEPVATDEEEVDPNADAYVGGKNYYIERTPTGGTRTVHRPFRKKGQ